MFHEHVNTSVIADESLPWVPFAPYTDQVHLKYYKLDPIRGEVIVMMRAPAGVQLPRHHHSGTVIVYTVKGRWKYAEHDWIAGPGSIVYETAGESHTPQVVDAADDGELLVLNIVVGDLIFMDANNNVLAIENWKSALKRYQDHCQANGIEPRDLTAYN